MPEPSLARGRSRPALLLGVVASGGVGWVVDTTLLWVLAVHLGVPTPLAAGIAFLASAVVTFVLNRLVFRAQDGRTGQQGVRFALLVGLNALIIAALVPLWVHVLHAVLSGTNLRLLVAKIVTTALVLPFNAFMYHRWVFAPGLPEPGSGGADGPG